MDEQLVGELGREDVRGLVEDGEREQEGLVPKAGRRVAEPVTALLLHRGLPEIREPGQRLRAAVVRGQRIGERGRLGRPAIRGGEETGHRFEGEQRVDVVRPVPGQQRPYDVPRARRNPGARGDAGQVRRVLDGDDEVAVGLPELVAGREQVGVAQRAVAAQRQVAQDVPAGPGELCAQRGRRGLGAQGVDGAHAQPVQQHHGGGVAAGGVGAAEDQDALVAQPFQGAGEGGALGEHLGQRLQALVGYLAGGVLGGGRRAVVVDLGPATQVDVAVDLPAGHAVLGAADQAAAETRPVAEDEVRGVREQFTLRGRASWVRSSSGSGPASGCGSRRGGGGCCAAPGDTSSGPASPASGAVTTAHPPCRRGGRPR